MFKSWGRVSTIIGDQTSEPFENLDEARIHFEDTYLDKTGNLFFNRQFEKKPNKYFKHDIDCGDETEIRALIESKLKCDIESHMEKSVQELIKLIFSEKMMKETMLEFDLDAEKLPCGKISKQQILCAMEVLNDISKLIEENPLPIKFIEASNKFYTMIPHNFGMKMPTIIDTQDLVKNKTEMLETLQQIKLVYGLVKKGSDASKNPLDAYYTQLKTDLRSIDKTGPEYQMIQEYVTNTHSPFHDLWDSLEIEEVFQVKREGEDERFGPFKNFNNRQLLWHGSRTTNFAGILLNGLRIAPTEAPVTGYILGKGIYFAEMVSKSALYCQTTSKNNIGLMLLCNVALGDTLDLIVPRYIVELPADKHSTKGIGSTYPNPRMARTRPDGVTVPLGELITDTERNKRKVHQLYNSEYVVYDAAQVNCEYLVRVKFHYKEKL